MGIIGTGRETYLYVNGISCSHEISLRKCVTLVPVDSKIEFDIVSRLIKSDMDYSIAVLSSATLSSQLRITSSDVEQLTVATWNAQWDCILLGALFNCEVMSNLQCDKPVNEQEKATYINVTNYAFRALLRKCYNLSENDEKWLNSYYSVAMDLTNFDTYRTAVHAMASYRWHSMPRVQLAILWSGIESLFNVSTEVSFRVSLYIARFLAGRDDIKANEIFKKVKKLYNMRSSAVHGNKMKEDISSFVDESAALLNQLILRCAEIGELPNTDKLIFNV
ncbi:HEPN domain-containing protein [Acutalibacter sp. 1XD8-36]|uniref:HEPN domain-containing protein n=1 Tax=Acutalibacter sp. 1XD8-36 TaxID=2320852 RepID=UPI00141327B1|nr:HEPN domain-containing protein [Acutalibacter sp. 1XD8-36]